jgi:hypothetical protein
MTAEMNRSSKLADMIEQISKAFKSANIGQGQKVGYREDSSEERLQATAEHEGVKLYRNPDGSHLAVDESHSSYERLSVDLSSSARRLTWEASPGRIHENSYGQRYNVFELGEVLTDDRSERSTEEDR